MFPTLVDSSLASYVDKYVVLNKPLSNAFLLMITASSTLYPE